MIHIKSNDELILEKIDFKKWKYYVMGISLYAAIASYPNFRKAIGMKSRIDDITMHNMINDIESEATSKQKILIDDIKKSIIEEVISNNKLDNNEKEKVVNAIEKIKIVMTSNKNINLISSKEGSVAFYMNYIDIDKIQKKIIMVSEDSSTLSITHEIYHLIDDILGNNTSNYSEITEIINILDKDIVMKNSVGIKKLETKIDFFIEESLKQIKKDSINQNKHLSDEEIKIRVGKLKKIIIEDIKGIIYSDKEYITSPSEIYVRFRGLKRWLLKEKFINNINEDITKKTIIDIFRNTKLFNNLEKGEIDHFELLFMLNLDITNEVESDEDIKTLKRANSIVTRYSDYNKNDDIT